MDPWKIEAVKADPENVGTHDLLISFITCERAWKRLSKPAREALRAAYTENILVYAHPLTIKSLERHGFVVGAAYSSRTAVLTDAGREVRRWVVRA